MPGNKQPVFTIFNHGTNADRDGEGEIVAEFGRLAAGTEYTNFLICDGPGSKPTSSVTPGQFNPFTRNKEAKKTFGKKELGNTHENWAFTGTATGAGWNDNVIHAMAALSELDPLPGTVNMIGWSRGGVTCTKMAYKLRELYPQIDVNIFAVDPVAGLGNKSDVDASTIRGNVKNYLAVLSMHEQRGWFKPQDEKRVTFTNSRTNAIYVPFPGNHTGQVNLDKSVRKDRGEAPQMVWFMAMKFLEQFGTQFSTEPSPSYDLREQCNLYAKMQLKMSEYKKTGKGFIKSLMGGTKTRDFLRNKNDQYTKNADFFINEHHRRVFKRAYPAIYEWVFMDLGTNPTIVAREFETTSGLLGLRRTLIDLGFKPRGMNGAQTTLVPIRGSAKQPEKILRMQHRASMSRMGLY